MTLQQLRDTLLEWTAALDVAVEAQAQAREAQGLLDRAQSDMAACQKQCATMVADAHAETTRARLVVQEAEKKAGEIEAAAHQAARNIEGGLEETKNGLEARVAEVRAEFKSVRDELAAGRAELVALQKDLDAARQSVRELLSR